MRWWFPLVLLPACAPDLGPPVWAVDSLFLEPLAAGAVQGVQSWSLYDAAWGEARRPGRLVCAAVVELSGGEVDGVCQGCNIQWAVTATLVEHDCPDGSLEGTTLFEDVKGIGLGPLDPDLADESPSDEARGGWIQYRGLGWQAHGWAWPDGAVARDEPFGPWDGERPFVFWPAFAWSLDGTAP